MCKRERERERERGGDKKVSEKERGRERKGEKEREYYNKTLYFVDHPLFNVYLK